jgi:hypothetical protein
MDSDEVVDYYDCEDYYDDDYDNDTGDNLNNNQNDESDEQTVKELNSAEIFDLMMKQQYDLKYLITIDYSQLSQDEKDFVMEEIIDNMVAFAMKKSGYVIGYYPKLYLEHLNDKRYSGHISETKYNTVINLIENCLRNSEICFTDKIKSLSAYTDTDEKIINDAIIIAWNPAINYPVNVVNIS